MLLLLVFAFIAGVVTVLSPCILPVLPIILSSSVGGKPTSKARPFGVVTGFIASFTFFTLFLSSLVQLSGISADFLRHLSVVVIAGFGLALLIPQFQVLLEKFFSKFTRFSPKGTEKKGFWGGVIVGLSLGLLWTPCVGAILASVISLAITGTVTTQAFLITFAYSLGTALPMFFIIIGGQNALRKVPWLTSNTAKIQKAFGVLMIVTALGIAGGADRKFQTFILTKFPNYGTGLTKFEDIKLIRDRLSGITGGDINEEDMGKPTYELTEPKGIRAPELIQGGQWFNSEPLTLAELKGKVVIIDFWTYSCINCQRTLPYLNKWYQTYKDRGLVIIGVHSPEFEFEKDPENVAKAISDFGVKHPVMQDNNFETWRAYKNRYWPAKYFIDREGYVRYTHFGEGSYDESEKVIQELLEEGGSEDISTPVSNPDYQNYAQTPETYLGYGRIAGFASSEKIVKDQISAYTAPAKIPSNGVAYDGDWLVTEEYANPQQGSKLYLNFEAKEVYLVMSSANGYASRVKVFVDGKVESLGEDALNGVVTVESDSLYKIVKLTTPGRHILRLEFEDSNTLLYAFTFG